MDAIGLISRDLTVLDHVVHSYYPEAALPDNLLTSQNPRMQKSVKLLYPTDRFPVEDEIVQGIYDKLIVHLEASLGVERQGISLDEAWSDFSANTANETFDKYFHSVSTHDITPWTPLIGEKGFLRLDHVGSSP